MPVWSDILKELQLSRSQPNQPLDFDRVRRRYLAKLSEHTGRDTILYASGWLQSPSNTSPTLLSINDEDIQALMEVTSDLSGQNLDLILHSPRGSPEAAGAIVSYLRSRFDNIRVIVPNLAMSAATMIACAADEITMGKHSFLGPIDPQLPLMTPVGLHLVPAQAILDQFAKAQKECQDPQKVAAWTPMLSQYGPALLVQCENALEMSQELVAKWLKEFMLKDSAKAEEVSAWLADHSDSKSHSRHLPRQELIDRGLPISKLECDDDLQDLSLSVFHATTHTFSGTPVTKIVENHNGRAFIKMMRPSPPVPPAQPS